MFFVDEILRRLYVIEFWLIFSEDPSLPPLAENWIAVFDTKNQRFYYANRVTKQTSWFRKDAEDTVVVLTIEYVVMRNYAYYNVENLRSLSLFKKVCRLV